MSFVGKLGQFLKDFVLKAIGVALHSVPSNKILPLIDRAKLIISMVEETVTGPGRGQEKWDVALKMLGRYAASEGLKLAEHQLETILQNAFSETVGAEKVAAIPPPAPAAQS